MKSLSTYINSVSGSTPTGKTMKGFFSNIGGDPIRSTIDIVNKLRDIKNYRSNADYCANLCMQFPVDFGIHASLRDKSYQLYYIKNKKGSFDWAEKSSFRPNWHNNVNYEDVSAIRIIKGLHILFSNEYIVKPCYRDKNNNIKDL